MDERNTKTSEGLRNATGVCFVHLSSTCMCVTLAMLVVVRDDELMMTMTPFALNASDRIDSDEANMIPINLRKVFSTVDDPERQKSSIMSGRDRHEGKLKRKSCSGWYDWAGLGNDLLFENLR